MKDGHLIHCMLLYLICLLFLPFCSAHLVNPSFEMRKRRKSADDRREKPLLQEGKCLLHVYYLSAYFPFIISITGIVIVD